MEPQHSIPDSSDPVYFTGVKQDFKAHRILFEKTVRLEEIISNTQADTQHIFYSQKDLNIPQDKC